MAAKQSDVARSCGRGARRQQEAPRGDRNRRKFEQVLSSSSCNFSLGCDDFRSQAAATKMIAHEPAARLVSTGSRLLLELQAARRAAPGNSTLEAGRSLRHARHSNDEESRMIGLNQHIIKQQQARSSPSLPLLQHFSQADAAGAMVGVVRVILVILICVLLVKLHAVPSLGNMKSGKAEARGKRRCSRSEPGRAGSGGPEEGPQQKQTHRRRAPLEMIEKGGWSSSWSFGQQRTAEKRMISAEERQATTMARLNESATCHAAIGPNGAALRGREFQLLGAQATGARNAQRRLSQPSGPACWQQSSANPTERRRRHSDTNAIISSLQLPPGPMGLPFLGYLPFLGTEIHLTLTELSRRFGPIYQIFLGGIRVVVLNDAALVRQAFKQTVFSGRPDTQLTRILQGYGIVNSDGALWKEQRAFLHSALRKLGAKSLMSGTNGLEAKIQNQVREFVNDLSSHAGEGKPCQVRPIVARAVSSVVGSVVMNLTYRKYEEKFDRLIELMQEGFRLFSIAMPLDFIPIFRFLPGVSYAYKKMKRNRAETSAFFQTVADEHRRYLSETFNLNVPNAASSALHPSRGTSASGARPNGGGAPGEREERESIPKTILTSDTIRRTIVKPQSHVADAEQRQQQQQQQPTDLENIVARDLVDAYIMQQKRHEKDGKENYFSDQQLVQIMSDIFSAGLETVTSTIEWSILFLILNPECQERIQIEIDKVVGRNRLPQLEDLAQMPYTEATIYEVLRRSNVVALGNAHATLADASIGGYRIPKGTQVLPNLYGIHMNPKLWNEPDRFDPNRFIINERAQKPDYFIPFSVGRRMCLGDVLAKMEVFLFLVGLLQKYDLCVHEHDRACPPKVKGTIGVSNAPVPFRVALKARSNR